MFLKMLFASLVLMVFSVGCMGGDRFTPHGWSGLALEENVLYVSAGDGTLKALDTRNGAVLWTYPDADSGLPSLGQFYGSPVVVGSRIYVSSYELERDRCGGSGGRGFSPCGRVYGLEVRSDNGRTWVRRSWTFPRLDLPAVGSFVGKPVVTGDLIIAASSDGKVYAVNATTGDRVWEFATDDRVWSTPSVSNNVVFFGSMDHTLYAVSLARGELLWEFEAEGAITSRPLVVDGTVYFGSFDHKFYALNADTGYLVWEFLADQWIWADSVTDGKSLFMATLGGLVYSLDLTSGRPRWLVPGSTIGAIVAAPIIIDGYVVVVSDKGFLSAFRRDDGGKEWEPSLESPVRTTPVAQEEILFLSYEDGLVGPVNVANHRLDGDPTLWPKVRVTKE